MEDIWRMKALVPLFALLALPTLLCHAAEQSGQSGRDDQSPPLRELSDVSPARQPSEIFSLASMLASRGDYDTAAKAVAVATAYAAFDAARVADPASRSAPDSLAQAFLASMDSSALEGLRTAQRLAKQAEICALLEALGPPSYNPNYMLGYGVNAETRAALEKISAMDDSELSGKGWTRERVKEAVQLNSFAPLLDVSFDTGSAPAAPPSGLVPDFDGKSAWNEILGQLGCK